MDAESEFPPNTDMRIERTESEVGLSELKIIAHTQQSQIDLAMEYPRIIKLLSRDWQADDAG